MGFIIKISKYILFLNIYFLLYSLYLLSFGLDLSASQPYSFIYLCVLSGSVSSWKLEIVSKSAANCQSQFLNITQK